MVDFINKTWKIMLSWYKLIYILLFI